MGLRAGVATPTAYRHGDKFTTDPIRKGTTRGRLPSDTPEMMIEHCVVGKRQTSRGSVSGKKCFVSLAEMTLAPVTFSLASHHSVLFFILSGYTSASEIRTFWSSTLSLSPLGLNLFTNAATKCNLKFFRNTRREQCYIKVPKKHLLTCYSELITSKCFFQNAASK